MLEKLTPKVNIDDDDDDEDEELVICFFISYFLGLIFVLSNRTK